MPSKTLGMRHPAITAARLAAENPKWCCNEGKNVLDPLPPLTPGLQSLMSVPRDAQRVCQSSRSLNNLFCLSALGVSEKWTEYRGVPNMFVFFYFYFTCLLPQVVPFGLQCEDIPTTVFSIPIMKTSPSTGFYTMLKL